MPKKTSDEKPKRSRLNAGEPTPPLLSEKLIAQLQGAVNAAQRTRIAKPIDTSESKSGNEF